MRLLATLFVLLWSAAFAQAAGTATPVAIVVSSCGAAGIFGPPGNSAPLTVDTAGNLCGSGGGGGGGGTSSSFGATFPTTGTAVGMSDGTNMVPFTTTDGTSLDVNCVTGCSGGGGGGDVNITEIGGNPVSTTVPVSGTVILGAGSAVIGHVVVDSGTLSATQSGSWTVAATQSGSWNVGQSGTWNIGTVTSITNPVDAAQSGTWTIDSITDPVAVTQSGSWNVGQSGAPWKFEGAGTAGTPTGGVLTVQGDASGEPVPVDCVSGCSGGGGGGTSSNFGSAFPTAGTAAGASDGTNMVPLLVDASGFLKVILQTGSNVIGAVTQSGTWNIGTLTSITNAVTVAQGTASNLLAQVSNNGTFAVQATQSGSWTATVTQGTASNLKAQVTGAGSAGTADSGVVTVQGISGMTAVKVDGTGGSFPVSGTVAATQSGTWNVGQSGSPWGVTGSGSAGSPASGVVTVQGIPSGSPVAGNVTFLGSNAINLGAGNAGTGTQRVILATDQAALAAWGLGATAASVPSGAQYIGGNKSGNLTGLVMGSSNDLTVGGAGTAGSAAGGVLTVQGVASMTPVQISQATASNLNATVVGTGTFAVQAQPTPVTTGGLSSYVVEPGASDNHNNIKNGAGQVYSIAVFNNSDTVNYIRLYNAATGFNGCNSATNLMWEGNIPASTSGAGFVYDLAQGLAFSTGISICVTSGYGQTNTTAATASAMSVNVLYK